MARERRSLQDLIRSRQQSGFVGRQGQVIQYQENLGFPSMMSAAGSCSTFTATPGSVRHT